LHCEVLKEENNQEANAGKFEAIWKKLFKHGKGDTH